MSNCGKKCGILAKLKNNRLYRKRFLLTLAACLTYVIEGWVVLQYGTALPDVMLLIGVDLETASWLFSVRSIGFVVGSVLFGILLDRYERVLIMFVGTVCLAVCTLLTPYLVWYPVALGLRAINGVFAGGVDTGCNTIVSSIWGIDGGPYMQALYFSYTIGGIVAPLVTEPFMSPKHKAEGTNVERTVVSGKLNYNKTIAENVTSNQNPDEHLVSSLANTLNITVKSVYESGATANETENFGSNGSTLITTRLNTTNNTVMDTDIEYSFIITAIAVFMACVPYLIMYILGGFDVKANRTKVPEIEDECKYDEKDAINVEEELNIDSDSDTKKDNSDPDSEVVIKIVSRSNGRLLWQLKIVIVCIAMVNLLYSAAEECLGAYIVTFCLDYLGWDNGPSAAINSVYWITSFVGGICGIGLVQILKTGRLLFLAHVVWILAFLCALIGSLTYNDVLIWLSVPASGIFMVQIVPASISWIEENVCEVTGKITSVIMIFTGLGLTLNPVFTGYMMQMFSFVTFMYILLADAVVCFLFYCVGFFINRINNG